ncbi:hypothetical protein M2408_003544 [Sphingobacterium sp. BIGb0165]|nr:hypothetical protein [Sphingobacterium sp. BIGb0165]
MEQLKIAEKKVVFHCFEKQRDLISVVSNRNIGQKLNSYNTLQVSRLLYASNFPM